MEGIYSAIQWVFSGIGTSILSLIFGLIIGGAITYKIVFKGRFKQVQKVGDNANVVGYQIVPNGKNQVGGDGTTLNQVETQNNFNITGIDEKRAREIYSELINNVSGELIIEARALVEERCMKFANELIPRLERVENGFDSFSEPDLHYLMKDILKKASTTDRQSDYELLSELLIERIKCKEDINYRTAIKKAIEAVTDVSNEGLSGIAIKFILINCKFNSTSIADSISKLNNLFKGLYNSSLLNSNNNSWLENLEILNLVVIKYDRMTVPLGFRGMLEMMFKDYFKIGIKKNSDTYLKAIELLNSVNLSSNILIEHELNEGYVRIPIVNNCIQYDDSYFVNEIPNNKMMSDLQLSTIGTILNMYSDDKTQEEIIRKNFNKMLNKYKEIGLVETWYHNSYRNYDITHPGRILADLYFRILSKDI